MRAHGRCAAVREVPGPVSGSARPPCTPGERRAHTPPPDSGEAGGTADGAGGGRTHGFRLVRRLDLLALQLLPVDVPEERMLLDIALAFGPAAQALARVLGHQLQENTEKRHVG